jgi:membrane associated rhomboid family serine protease
MINEFSRFAKAHFQRSENGLMQILLLNALSFLAILLLKIVLVVGGYEATYTSLCQNLVLPALWPAYLHQPWALLTHFWVHTSFFPTFWGLLLLHTLGQIAIQRLGSRHFVALYLLGGLAGGGFFLLLYNVAPHYQGTAATLSGFSGSLYAVVVAAAMLSPQHSLLFFLLGPLQLKYIVGFLVLFAVVNLVGNEPATSIAHLGGALLGYIYVKQFEVYAWLRQHWVGLKKSSQRLKVTHRRTAPLAKEANDIRVDQANLDHILDKVAASGYESLTSAEKQQLFNAGK